MSIIKLSSAAYCGIEKLIEDWGLRNYYYQSITFTFSRTPGVKLGLTVGDINASKEEIKAQAQLGYNSCCKITKITPDSIVGSQTKGQEMKMRINDVIVKVNDKLIVNSEILRAYYESIKGKPDKLSFTVLRRNNPDQ